MRISVVMRTKNADWVVEQALRALHTQTIRNFQLVVVDSGSTDRTLDIVREYHPLLIEIPSAAYIPGAVLNQAIEKSNGEILVFQNSDTVPMIPDALERLVDTFDDRRVVASFARQIPRPEAASWVRRDYAASFPDHDTAPQWMPYSLPFAAMRRSIWDKHHFHSAVFGSEDIEWGIWARRAGYVIRYVPQAIVMHSHNYTLREAFGRRFIEGEADAFIYENESSLAKSALRIISSSARDIGYQRQLGDWRGILESPFRRTAFHLGYHLGHRHGERRRNGNSQDSKLGQRLVLETFGGSGAREDR